MEKTSEGGQRKKFFERRALKELKLGRRALEYKGSGSFSGKKIRAESLRGIKSVRGRRCRSGGIRAL